MTLKLIFLGDVVGRIGREAVAARVAEIKRRYKPDVMMINGENSAAGFGITETIYNGFRDLGFDAVTLGNHAFDKKEALVFIERSDRLIRPMNFALGTPGRGTCVFETSSGARVLLAQAMGQVFMHPTLDNPFVQVDRMLEQTRLEQDVDVIVLDFHAEATSEKQAMGYLCDGRASLVVGTHTHVQTNDAQILPEGTGYITDLGMCGAAQSILGMDREEPLHRFLTGLPRERFQPASGAAVVCGCYAEIDPNGLCIKLQTIKIDTID